MPRGFETFGAVLRNGLAPPANNATVTYNDTVASCVLYATSPGETMFTAPRPPFIAKADFDLKKKNAKYWDNNAMYRTFTIRARVDATVPAQETTYARALACVGAGKPWSDPPAGLVQHFTSGTGTRASFLALVEPLVETPLFREQAFTMDMNAGWARTAAIRAAWLALQPDTLDGSKNDVPFTEVMMFRKCAGAIHMSACALAGHNRVMGFAGPNGHHAAFQAGLDDFNTRLDAIVPGFSNVAVP